MFDRKKENRRRDKRLAKNMAKGQREVREILRNAGMVTNGIVSAYVGKRRFVTSAGFREQLYRELLKEYRKLDLDIEDWTRKNVNRTARDFWNFARADLPNTTFRNYKYFSKKHVEEIIAGINPESVKSKVAVNASIGGMYKADIRALRAAVSTTFAEAAVEGLTNPEKAERMRRKIEKTRKGFAFKDRAGRTWKADTYFGMLNRTLHANTAREAYIATATKEAGHDLYTITGGVTGSSADNPNDPCDAWAGRIFSMTGNTKGYPTYQDALDAGVYHPNCVHTMRVVLPSEVEEIEAAAKERRYKSVIG